MTFVEHSLSLTPASYQHKPTITYWLVFFMEVFQIWWTYVSNVIYSNPFKPYVVWNCKTKKLLLPKTGVPVMRISAGPESDVVPDKGSQIADILSGIKPCNFQTTVRLVLIQWIGSINLVQLNEPSGSFQLAKRRGPSSCGFYVIAYCR